MGVQAIISHPERHPILVNESKILLKWLEQSAHLQVTSASLLGQFGPIAQRAAWTFLTSGWVSFVATDSHDLEVRRPCMRAAFEQIGIGFGDIVARLVCIENPLRVIKGQDIIPMGSVEDFLSLSTKACPERSRRNGSDERVRSCS
jgi:protein-tyrosine phosphatase